MKYKKYNNYLNKKMMKNGNCLMIYHMKYNNNQQNKKLINNQYMKYNNYLNK